MYNRFTRITGMISISILSASLVSVATAVPISPAAPTVTSKSTSEVISNNARINDDTARLQAREALTAIAIPREYRVATSKDAKDWKGYKKSLYRGKYYSKDQEHFRQCVMHRESRHNYRAANRVSSARGAYQFLDNKWRNGLVYMMIKESKKSDDFLIPEIKDLRKKPIHKWNRYYQDRAFFTAMNYNGKWSGKKHWYITVPGTGC